jgi:carboxymethylenebutenolidase
MLQEQSSNSRPVRKTALANGFAAAVKPVTARTITTDDDGIIAGEVKIPTADGDIPGYSARPSEGSNFPIVLVIHEVFGVHEHIKDVCRRFAKAGYSAVAPELFVRQGDVSTITDIGQLIATIVSKAPDSQVLSDVDSAVEFAVESAGGDVNRLAITGFCWGGRIVWLYAAHSTALKVGGAFYGRLIGQYSDNQPKFPIDVASSLNAPVQGFYGGLDHSIPLDSVDAMSAALKSANSPSFITVYPEAGHAFFADYRPSYNEEAAESAWTSLLSWFRSNGV